MQVAIALSKTRQFERTIRDYYRAHGRDLPWRWTTDPYHILVSEVMLQQTQVHRVIPKYEQFIGAFPGFPALAKAPLSSILAVWQGMGYNRRAVFLKRIAERVVNECGGTLPDDPEILETFPGIGKATAASIVAFAFNKPVPFIETNVRTVFIHYFFGSRDNVHDKELMHLVEQCHDTKNPREWYYALMDYGSMLKKSGNAGRRSAHYTRQKPFKGSDRQLRGMIVKLFTERHELSERRIARELDVPAEKIRPLLAALETEGFIRRKGKQYSIM